MINDFLLSIINFFYRVVPNYGVAIILFTIFIKLCLSPLDLKSRRSMKRMSDINPKIEELKKKYGNDREKLNAKTQELYQKEKINPLSGCLPMLLTFPILIAMFAAMRSIANEELVRQYLQLINGQATAVEPFLWIKNLWMPDNFASSVMPNLNALKAVGAEVWIKVSAALPGVTPLADKEAVAACIAGIPDAIAAAPQYADFIKQVAGWSNINLLLFNFSVYVHMNGYYVLPILAVATQYASQKLTPATASTDGNQQAASTNKTMMMLMPLMSLWFCSTSSAAFALYWVTSNIIATVQQIVFNRYFAWQDRKAAVAEEVGIK